MSFGNSFKQTPKQLTERLFFHDIINLTHGLILFLSNKKASKKSIEVHELEALEKEIRTLQMMLKDHFQLKHKNIDDQNEWMPLKEIKPALNGLLDTYLGQKNIIYSLNFVQESDSQLIYLPVFYRIMNNLIKNMSEAKTTHAQIDLVFEKNYLLIETKNKMNEISMADKKDRSIEGLGLESIRLLALENGGSFSHEMVNLLWCNHIKLPLKTAEVQTKIWANKKAA
jgi:hypothetical protein